MGLRPDEETAGLGGVLRAWSPAITLAVAAILCTLLADREQFQYEREAILAGDILRLVTGHFAHLGPAHLLLNLLGLALVWFIVRDVLNLGQWWLVIGVSVAVIDAGFLALLPDLGWYVGLSGLLHGMLAAGVIAGWRPGRPEIRILGLLVAAKLAWEASVGPLPGSGAAAGGEVITEAHLFGALGGLLAAGAILIRVRASSSI